MVNKMNLSKAIRDLESEILKWEEKLQIDKDDIKKDENLNKDTKDEPSIIKTISKLLNYNLILFIYYVRN